MIRVRLPGGVCTPGAVAEARRARPRLRRRHAAADHPPDLPVPPGAEARPAPAMQGLRDVLLDTKRRLRRRHPRGDGDGQPAPLGAPRRGRMRWPKQAQRPCRATGPAPTARSGTASRARGDRRAGGALLRRDLHAAEVQDRLRHPARRTTSTSTPRTSASSPSPRGGRLEGFNVAIGGGMGRTDSNAEDLSPPRRRHRLHRRGQAASPTIDAVMSVQRDYGDRVDRLHARFKYTIDDKGLDWIKAEIERRLGFALEPAQALPLHLERRPARLGPGRGRPRALHALHRERPGQQHRRAAAARRRCATIARVHKGTFRVTPNQNLIIAERRARGPAGDRGGAGGARPRPAAQGERAPAQLHGLRRAADLRPRHGRERALPARARDQDRGDPGRARPRRASRSPSA